MNTVTTSGARGTCSGNPKSLGFCRNFTGFGLGNNVGITLGSVGNCLNGVLTFAPVVFFRINGASLCGTSNSVRVPSNLVLGLGLNSLNNVVLVLNSFAPIGKSVSTLPLLALSTRTTFGCLTLSRVFISPVIIGIGSLPLLALVSLVNTVLDNLSGFARGTSGLC